MKKTDSIFLAHIIEPISIILLFLKKNFAIKTTLFQSFLFYSYLIKVISLNNIYCVINIS